MPHDDELMTPRYRLAKVMWEAQNATPWQEIVDAAAKEYENPKSATALVSKYLKMARAVQEDGWHL